MKCWLCTVVLLLPLLGISQNWQPDFDTALSKSSQENKPVILVFSGSDWCAPCIKLEKSIWQSEAFKEHASKNYVLYKADFPKKKKNELPRELLDSHKELAQQFNPKGYFPLVLVLDKDANVLGTTGYERFGPKKYIKLLDSFLQ